MKTKFTSYLMFRGEAEEAMNYYIDAFSVRFRPDRHD